MSAPLCATRLPRSSHRATSCGQGGALLRFLLRSAGDEDLDVAQVSVRPTSEQDVVVDEVGAGPTPDSTGAEDHVRREAELGRDRLLERAGDVAVVVAEVGADEELVKS